MDWDKLRVFHTVKTAGGFVKAASILNITQSAVSRQIHIIEQDLKTPVFIRKKSGVLLTPAGEELFAIVDEVYKKISRTEIGITELEVMPKGRLNLFCSLSLGTLWLTPRLQRFFKDYPDMQMSVMLENDNTPIDLTEQGDLALVDVPPPTSEVTAHVLTTYQPQLYASQSYLEAYGTPTTPQDLNNHRLVVFGQGMHQLYTIEEWSLTLGSKGQRIPHLVVNTYQALAQAIASGFGIGSLPPYAVTPGLVPVLPECKGPSASIYLLHPDPFDGLYRLEIFMDFLKREIWENRLG